MSQLDALWEFQQAELELAKLTKEMKSSPAYQKRGRLHKVLVEHQERIKGYETQIGEYTEQIASLEAQLAALTHDLELETSELESMQQDEAVTAAELTESRRAIERLVGKVNALNRELTKLSAACDELVEAIGKTYSEAARAKRDYDAVRTVCDAEKDSYQPKIDALTKEIEERKAKIPPDLMKRYERLKKNYQQPIAKVVNGQCGGCYMMLSSVAEKRVAAGAAIVQCENCGRLLIM